MVLPRCSIFHQSIRETHYEVNRWPKERKTHKGRFEIKALLGIVYSGSNLHLNFEVSITVVQ